MPIRYFLRPNQLPTSPDAFVAQVQAIQTLTEADIIDRMDRKGTTVNKEDALATIYLYQQTILEALTDGYNVVTDTANYSASIRGTFPQYDTPFRRDRHTIRPVVQPGKRLRAALQKAAVVRQEPPIRKPLPQTLYDAGSNTTNNLLTPNGIARLNGRRLKYDPTDPTQGIFFVNEARQQTAVTLTAKISPSELVFVIPALPPGTYTLVLRTCPQHILLEGPLDKPLRTP